MIDNELHISVFYSLDDIGDGEMAQGHKSGYSIGWISLVSTGGDRVKIGFTSEENLSRRVGEARRWAAQAEEVAKWPGMSSWEPLARDFVEGQLRIVRIADTEQFPGVLDVQKVKQCLDRLFSILPDLETIDAEKGNYIPDYPSRISLAAHRSI